MKIILTFIISFTVYSAAVAGEAPKTSMKFTGNSAVDLFSIKEPAVTLASPLLKSFDTAESEEEFKPKSPWLAGGMSLVLPGAGEFYTHSYVKAGIFFGIEVTSFILGRSYNNKGDNQTNFFQSYADAHYSAYQYAKWSLDNIGVLHPGLIADSFHVLQGPPDGPPFPNINWDELNRMESEIANGVYNGYTHQMPYYGEQQYYELIGKYDQFKIGWDDADTSPVSALPVMNRSPFKANWYFDQRALANRFYDIGNTYYTVLIINHIISALDAYWSATRFNSGFRAHADVKMVPTSNGTVAVPEANFSYDF
ncbi:MAG: hypothetical protein ACHQQQ_03005 [Bacteroidota bacterium]